MTNRIDVFAHVLPPKFYQTMLKIAPEIPQRFPFINIAALSDMKLRRQHFDGETRQVISAVNINPEDFTVPAQAADLCRQANQEISELVDRYPEMFTAGIAMVPMNNVPAAVEMINDLPDNLVGIQIFSRALGKSIADPTFAPVFAAAAKRGLLVLLHPVFDSRKPDNNLVFSWEYELSQAMLQLIQAGLFERWPEIKLIVHHAGAMVPFFAERITHILSSQQAADFKKFYVDTALLGNAPALRLTLDYFGADHVLFGTDAPFGEAPAGATQTIIQALAQLKLAPRTQEAINKVNYQRLVANIK